MRPHLKIIKLYQNRKELFLFIHFTIFHSYLIIISNFIQRKRLKKKCTTKSAINVEKCFPRSILCLQLISRSTVCLGVRADHGSPLSARISRDFLGRSGSVGRIQVDRERSNDDVRSIAIQYRYLRSFHRNEEHISASYVFRA